MSTDGTGTAGRRALLGAMFLMATSAIGPGFITQTTEFTARLGAAFAFAVLVSILIDIAVQMNVWRVVGVSRMRAHELANRVLPGAGWVLTALVVTGGLIFNIANVAGAGLGLNALLGLDAAIGGAISALVATAIFLIRRAGVALDRILVVLGGLMVALTTYVAVVSAPPLGEALRQTVLPDQIDFLVITTLVGGTVGGYITYAGAHRMLDSGLAGRENAGRVAASSVQGILITAVMRVVLFLAVLGVVATGVDLAGGDNPTATAFEAAAGEIGLRLFGVILWAAGISSVIGAAYTSVTFLTSAQTSRARRTTLTAAFILVSAAVFVLLGTTPVTLLIFAGAFNGLILPFGFGVILWVAWRRRDLLEGYRYPRWLLVAGVVAWLLTLFIGYQALVGLGALSG